MIRPFVPKLRDFEGFFYEAGFGNSLPDGRQVFGFGCDPPFKFLFSTQPGAFPQIDLI